VINTSGGVGRKDKMAKVEIYTKFLCPYCARAKRLLDQHGAPYEEYDITMGGPRRTEMMERAPGHYTVPQIFINDRHVGGSDELALLERRGELATLLAG
jgi:glutaredoxin 3